MSAVRRCSSIRRWLVRGSNTQGFQSRHPRLFPKTSTRWFWKCQSRAIGPGISLPTPNGFDHDIGRLNVSMNNASIVSVGHGVGKLEQDVGGIFEVDRPILSLEKSLQIETIHKVRYNKRSRIPLANPLYRDDPLVGELGRVPGFSQQALKSLSLNNVRQWEILIATKLCKSTSCAL